MNTDKDLPMDIQTIKFQATDQAATEIETGCLVIGVFSGRPVREQLPELDAATDGLLTEMAQEGELSLGAGKTLMIHHPRGIKARRLLVTGLGKAARFEDATFVRSARGAGAALRRSRASDAVCLLARIEVKGRDLAWKTAQAALALDHADYIYSATKKADPDAPPVTDRIAFPAAEGVEDALKTAAGIAAGVRRCRLLGDLPPNICTPAFMAEVAEELAGEVEGLEVEVLEDAAMEKLEIGRASCRERVCQYV